MVLLSLFATILFVGLVVVDWLQFSSRRPDTGSYGCRIARVTATLDLPSIDAVAARFDPNGVLALPNGLARFVPQHRLIVLRPQQGLLPKRFRTAWPVKAALRLEPDASGLRVTGAKLIPWSSAAITLLWFLLVGLGTLAFAILYLTDGGLASLQGILMGLGILGIGLLVLAFGLVTVAFAYRLENTRLMQAYQDLASALTGSVQP